MRISHHLYDASGRRARAHGFPETLQTGYVVFLWPLRPILCRPLGVCQLHLARKAPHQHAHSARSILLASTDLIGFPLQPDAQAISQMFALNHSLPLDQGPRDTFTPHDLARPSVVLAALLGQDVRRDQSGELRPSSQRAVEACTYERPTKPTCRQVRPGEIDGRKWWLKGIQWGSAEEQVVYAGVGITQPKAV